MRKTLRKTNQRLNFLGGSFSYRDDLRASIQFKRERQTQHLKYFVKSRPIHFHINSNSIIIPVKRNKQSLPALKSTSNFHVDEIQVQNPTLVTSTDQMPDYI